MSLTSWGIVNSGAKSDVTPGAKVQTRAGILGGSLLMGVNTFRIEHSGFASPDTSATRPSPASKLPHEIVEMIVSRLAWDMPSLHVCSMTCYSWYIVSVPYLHRILITTTFRWSP